MTEEQKTVDTVVTDPVVVKAPEGDAVKPELTEVEKELAALKAEREKDAELLKKLRRFEKENKDKAEKEAIEAGKFKELYEAEKLAREAIEGKVKARELDSAIKAELANFKAKAPDTVMKLIDKSAVQWTEDGQVDTKSILKILKEVKASDPILFEDETTVTPSVKRATDGEVVGGYEKELAAAKSQQDIEKILRKYGKM